MYLFYRNDRTFPWIRTIGYVFKFDTIVQLVHFCYSKKIGVPKNYNRYFEFTKKMFYFSCPRFENSTWVKRAVFGL